MTDSNVACWVTSSQLPKEALISSAVCGSLGGKKSFLMQLLRMLSAPSRAVNVFDLRQRLGVQDPGDPPHRPRSRFTAATGHVSLTIDNSGRRVDRPAFIDREQHAFAVRIRQDLEDEHSDQPRRRGHRPRLAIGADW